MNLEDYFMKLEDGLPTGDTERLRKILQTLKKIRELKGTPLGGDEFVQQFFRTALTPFYDCMWDGMDQTAGHIIYRLSDSLPAEKRQQIEIYPCETGSIVDNGGRSDSLEDWRAHWERYNPYIPELTKLLPEMRELKMLPPG